MTKDCASSLVLKQRLESLRSIPRGHLARQNAGFSLIELLTIVAIVGVLAGVGASTLFTGNSIKARLSEQYELAFVAAQGAVSDASISGQKRRLWIDGQGVFESVSQTFEHNCASGARPLNLSSKPGSVAVAGINVQVFQCSLATNKCDVDVSQKGMCILAGGELSHPYVVRYQTPSLSRHFTIYSTGLVARGLSQTQANNTEGVLIQ